MLSNSVWLQHCRILPPDTRKTCTWLGLVAALAMWAVSLGLPPIAAVLAVAVINVTAGAVLIYVCLGISRDLLFSATRRQVAGKFPVKPVSP